MSSIKFCTSISGAEALAVIPIFVITFRLLKSNVSNFSKRIAVSDRNQDRNQQYWAIARQYLETQNAIAKQLHMAKQLNHMGKEQIPRHSTSKVETNTMRRSNSNTSISNTSRKY